MTDPIPIHKGQDFYVPRFEVRLQGEQLRENIVRDILQVTYKDSIEEIDSFELTINNWDAERLAFKYSDEDRFDPGRQVELWMGYFGADGLRLMTTGEITSLRPSFPASGPPALAISGLNLLHRFRAKQESRVYENPPRGITDSEIARQIGGRLGVTIRTDSAAAAREDCHEYVLQDNEYDVVFLMKRARRIGYDLFVEERGEQGQQAGSALYFGPSVGVQRTTYELTYGQSLIQFQPNLTTANQVGKVTVIGWDATNREKIKATVTRADIQTQGVGTRGGQSTISQSFASREEVITNQPVSNTAEARTLALETLERIAKDMVKGSGSTVGLPDLRAGSVVHLNGMGDRFSGRYFVTATTHTISDSGYTTQFDCRREETSGR
jgi:phage protein D